MRDGSTRRVTKALSSCQENPRRRRKRSSLCPWRRQSRRLIVSDAATALKIPLISAAAAQLQGQIGLFRGWEDGQPCYRCFVGDAFDTDDCATCAEQGVLGALTATVGSFAALMAIRVIADIGEDVAGSLFLFDGVKLDWRKIRLPKDPNCRTCSA